MAPTSTSRVDNFLKHSKAASGRILKRNVETRSSQMIKHGFSQQFKTELGTLDQSTSSMIVREETTVKQEPSTEVMNGVTDWAPAITPDGSSTSRAMPLLEQAMAHLTQVDRRFEGLSERFTPLPWTEAELHKPQNHFKSLILGIMSQQVSGAAARAISGRFVGLFAPTEVMVNHIKVDIDPEVEDSQALKVESIDIVKAESSAAPVQASQLSASYFPSPQEVARSDVLTLKSAGLSLRKAEYVKGIAEAFVNGTLSDEFFDTADDEAIFKRLVSLRGIGPWSAEMFLMFSLKHPDVLSIGDIGIQRGMSWWSGKDQKNKSTHHKGTCKYMTEAEMHRLADTWRPYRSIGCWFMWRVDQAVALAEPKVEAKNKP